MVNSDTTIKIKDFKSDVPASFRRQFEESLSKYYEHDIYLTDKEYQHNLLLVKRREFIKKIELKGKNYNLNEVSARVRQLNSVIKTLNEKLITVINFNCAKKGIKIDSDTNMMAFDLNEFKEHFDDSEFKLLLAQQDALKLNYKKYEEQQKLQQKLNSILASWAKAVEIDYDGEIVTLNYQKSKREIRLQEARVKEYKSQIHLVMKMLMIEKKIPGKTLSQKIENLKVIISNEKQLEAA